MMPPMSVLETEHVCVIGVDPGRVKTGIAVVDYSNVVLWKGVIPSETVSFQLEQLYSDFSPRAIVIGNGTGTKECRASLLNINLNCEIETVPESHTSEEARRRVIANEIPTGFRRLIPRSLRFPLQAYDDEVAVILAERKLKEIRHSDL